MIVLHQFPHPPGQLSPSPFCLKLEAWLRLTGIPYRTEPSGDFENAPKGRMPWITDEGGRAVGDSRLAIEHLARAKGIDPDAHLGPRERALSLAVSALVEERLYFALVWWRWIDEANFRLLRDAYFGRVPEAMRAEVAGEARAGVAARLDRQGIGRHTPDEIAAIGSADVAALATLLGDGPWLFGEQPATADCTAWAMVANLFHPLFDTPLGAEARRHPALVAYYRTGLSRWFPDVTATV